MGMEEYGPHEYDKIFDDTMKKIMDDIEEYKKRYALLKDEDEENEGDDTDG